MNNPVQLHPTVCVVGKTYQIMVVTEKEALTSIQVGDTVYYYHSNGIRISSPGVHTFSVPMAELDKEGRYTLVVQEMVERLPYFPKTGEVWETTYTFRPLQKTNDIHIYHLADVHGEFEQAVGAFRFCNKETDLLILNGDISSTSDTFDDMILCYKIASEITKGEIPCIISRGNHDLRGRGAENLASLMPGEEGRSYYTFRVGPIWGILVDAGEDKDDSHPAYGGTICCHQFRLEQEKMIQKVIQNPSREYEEEGVEYKIVISHVPFTFKRQEPFDIEKPLFARWSKLMKEHIRPDVMLCGHTHKACISQEGSEYDQLGQPCTVIVASDMKQTEDNQYILAGASLTLHNREIEVTLNTKDTIVFRETVTV